MSKLFIHAEQSVRRYGGVPADYLDIHQPRGFIEGDFAPERIVGVAELQRLEA